MMAGPLEGVRIVEMDAIGPVPLASMILADLGATIVRLERPGGQAAHGNLGEDIVHRGRMRLTLDMKQPGDVARALELVDHADALLEGYRPGVMERLGLGPETCLARNPRLVYARSTGWGQTGPLAATAGHDINYIALSGALGAIGNSDGCPPPPLNLVGDYGGGAMFLVTGVLAGVLAARDTGRGDVVDVAMTDGVGVLMSMFVALRQQGGWSDARGDNLLDGAAPFYRCYECADGRHVAVGAIEPQFFQQLLAGLGLEPASIVQHDRSSWKDLTSLIAGRFALRSRDDWAEHFAGTDACVTPVLTISEALSHPGNKARSAHVRVGELLQPAIAPRFSRCHGKIREAGFASFPEVLSLFTEKEMAPKTMRP
ncbi:CaiB/BaiF CoA-transferase family protein [Aquibium sp. ELW1220]|uniref:CaiB/BaiF CoA transferase family protein n=1 Tax=Aquibium sp. ELW1220 TaxID=2976766 RepID=UPI0025AF677C|nr:CaiB/BaiF CoA-transferase family protein [Aquibium sp. ELW1220]MDN2583373.1 CoA transferase [Aquibium sp. ELW1220]